MYPENEAGHFLRTIKEKHSETAALTTNSLHSAKNQHVLICCGERKTCFIDGARFVLGFFLFVCYFPSTPPAFFFSQQLARPAQPCVTFSKLVFATAGARDSPAEEHLEPAVRIGQR